MYLHHPSVLLVNITEKCPKILPVNKSVGSKCLSILHELQNFIFKRLLHASVVAAELVKAEHYLPISH